MPTLHSSSPVPGNGTKVSVSAGTQIVTVTLSGVGAVECSMQAWFDSSEGGGVSALQELKTLSGTTEATTQYSYVCESGEFWLGIIDITAGATLTASVTTILKPTNAGAIDLHHTISIHDLDMDTGRPLVITSPYQTPSGDLPTNSLVHPSVIRPSKGVDGSQYLMLVTPFASADDQTENPCVFVSDDLLNWRVPSGVTNPIVDTPSAGYNSDNHVYEHTDGYLYMIYRERTTNVSNTVYGRRSLDGITWSTPVVLLTDTYTVQDWASPSFYHDGSNWILFSHNIASSNQVRKHVKSGDFLASWQAVSPSTVTPTHPNSLSWWHSDIRRLSTGRLIGLVLDGGVGGGPAAGPGGTGAAWLWQSDDAGVTWGVRPITRGKANYRSALVVDGEKINLLLVWMDATTAGVATYTEMWLHPLRPGRLRRKQVQRTMAAAVVYSMGGAEDEQNLIAHADLFAGTVANLTTPWTQVTGTNMQRNGSGFAAPSGVGTSAAVIACGSVDHMARVKINAYSAVATSQMFLILKYIDASNYIAIGIGDETTGKLEVKAVVAGVSTAFDEKLLLTPALATGQILRAYVDGLRLHAFVDGVKAFEGTIPAALAPGASAGIFAVGSTGNTFDDFFAGRL